MSRVLLGLLIAGACAAPASRAPAELATATSDPLACAAGELRELGYEVAAVEREEGVVRAHKVLRTGGGKGSAVLALKRDTSGGLSVQQASVFWTQAPTAGWTEVRAQKTLQDATAVATACASP